MTHDEVPQHRLAAVAAVDLMLDIGGHGLSLELSLPTLCWRMDLVHSDGLFAPTGLDEWFQPVDVPRMDVIRNLIAGPPADDDDLETAVSLTRLVHAELGVRPVSIPTHAHANWAFTAPGAYTLTVRANGTLADGTAVSTGDVTYTFVVGDLPDAESPSQLIVTTIDETDGVLVISVDPDDREVALPTLQLAADGQSLEASGELRPVTVTRPTAPGWSASGQVSDFTADGASFAGSHLGWTPVVLSQADGQNVEPGDAVPAGFPSGDGLSASSTLASASHGDGRGTARLGANLELRVPTDTSSSTYHATLTFTVI